MDRKGERGGEEHKKRLESFKTVHCMFHHYKTFSIQHAIPSTDLILCVDNKSSIFVAQ